MAFLVKSSGFLSQYLYLAQEKTLFPDSATIALLSGSLSFYRLPVPERGKVSHHEANAVLGEEGGRDHVSRLTGQQVKSDVQLLALVCHLLKEHASASTAVVLLHGTIVKFNPKGDVQNLVAK